MKKVRPPLVRSLFEGPLSKALPLVAFARASSVSARCSADLYRVPKYSAVNFHNQGSKHRVGSTEWVTTGGPDGLCV